MDRNYPSYRMMAELSRHQRDFVIRCLAASFKDAQRMLKGEGRSGAPGFLCDRVFIQEWNRS